MIRLNKKYPSSKYQRMIGGMPEENRYWESVAGGLWGVRSYDLTFIKPPPHRAFTTCVPKSFGYKNRRVLNYKNSNNYLCRSIKLFAPAISKKGSIPVLYDLIGRKMNE